MDKKPAFISDAIWGNMTTRWKSPEFQLKSQQAKKNRAFEKGGSLHIGGSIPHLEVKRKMEVEIGKSVDKWDLFKKTHTVKGTDRWVDTKSQMIVDKVRELKEASSSQASAEGASIPELDESSLLLTAIGGRNKKGRLYGLGSLGKTIESSSSEGSLSYNFGELGLQAENEKLKKKLAY